MLINYANAFVFVLILVTIVYPRDYNLFSLWRIYIHLTTMVYSTTTARSTMYHFTSRVSNLFCSTTSFHI